MKFLVFIFSTLIVSCAQYSSTSGSFRPLAKSTSQANKLVLTKDIHLTGQPEFEWPVKSFRMTRGFRKPTKKRKKHYGLDLASKLNTPIFASHPGLIVYAGSGYSGYGKVIILEYNETWATLYAHLNKFNVKEGQYVNSGDIIGYMGSTGRSTGVHLHFELIKDKSPQDPLNFLKKRTL